LKFKKPRTQTQNNFASKNPEIGTEVSENESEAAVNEKDVTKKRRQNSV